jgi:hypothetical protein
VYKIDIFGERNPPFFLLLFLFLFFLLPLIIMEEREPLLRDDDEQNNRIVNGKFTLLEKSLFGVSVALLISVCALAGLYARHTIEDNRPSPVEPIPTHNSSAVSDRGGTYAFYAHCLCYDSLFV